MGTTGGQLGSGRRRRAGCYPATAAAQLCWARRQAPSGHAAGAGCIAQLPPYRSYCCCRRPDRVASRRPCGNPAIEIDRHGNVVGKYPRNAISITYTWQNGWAVSSWPLCSGHALVANASDQWRSRRQDLPPPPHQNSPASSSAAPHPFSRRTPPPPSQIWAETACSRGQQHVRRAGGSGSRFVHAVPSVIAQRLCSSKACGCWVQRQWRRS